MRNYMTFQMQYESSLLENCRAILVDTYAKTELNSQSEFITTFLDTIPRPVFYKDVCGKYLGCNKAYEQFVGKTRNEIIGKTVHCMWPKELAEKYESMDKELFERSGKQIYGWTVNLSDGSKRKVIFHKATFNDLSGKTAGIIGIIQDAIEFTQIIDALQENGKDVKSILDAFTESIILTNTSGIVLDANGVSSHRLGINVKNLKGKSLYNLLSPEVAIKHRKMAGKAVTEGTPIYFEDESNGCIILTSIYPVFDKMGKVERLAIFGMDPTMVKNADDSLRKNGELCQIAIETILDGYVHLNLDGKILEVNDAYCTISGYTREELLCMCISDLEAIKNYDLTAVHICRAIELGKDCFETKHRTKDGRVLDIEVSATYLDKSDPCLLYFFKDITKRKQAEEKLRDSLQISIDIIRHIPSGLFIYQYESPDSLILVEINSEAERLTGVTAREFKGREFNEIWPMAHAAGVTDAFLEVIKTGKVFETENLYYKDKRIEGAFQTRAFCISQNMLGVAFENITEFKQKEFVLKSSESKFRSYIDSSPIGMFVVNSKGKYIDVNHAVCSMTGYAADELLSMNLVDLIVPAEKELVCEFYSALSKNGTISLMLKMLRKNSTLVHCQLDAVKLSEDRYLTFILDVTEQQKLQEQILLNETRLQSLVDILQHDSDSVQDLLDYALEKAIELTESRIGYIYFYNEERMEFILNTWSKDVMEECAISNPKTIYKLENTGIWGEVVRQHKAIIVNNFQATNPLKKGYPEGHVELCKYMTIPVFSRNKIVAVVGVANKDSDYHHTDLFQLNLLMDSVWKIVEKRNMDGEIEKREELMRMIFEVFPLQKGLDK